MTKETIKRFKIFGYRITFKIVKNFTKVKTTTQDYIENDKFRFEINISKISKFKKPSIIFENLDYYSIATQGATDNPPPIYFTESVINYLNQKNGK